MAGERPTFSLARAGARNPFLLPLISSLRRTLSDCATILDIGCGSCSPVRFIRNATLTGMDGHAPSLEKARQNRTHNEYFLGYVEALERAFPGRRFDACVALDLIEHLDKEDGRRFLSQVEAIATKKVVIFTPNGFLPQRSHDGDLQEHLSGWTTAEMRSFGYHVQGMGGPKSLRGEYHVIRYRPRFFWSMLSLLWHFGYTRSHPEASAALLCCRTVRKED